MNQKNTENTSDPIPLSGRFYSAMTIMILSAVAILFQEYGFLAEKLDISIEKSSNLIEFIEYLPITVLCVAYIFLILEFYQASKNRRHNKSSKVYLFISSFVFIAALVVFLVRLEINKNDLKYYFISSIPFVLGYFLAKITLQHIYRYKIIFKTMCNEKYGSIVKIVTFKKLIPVNLVFVFYAFFVLLTLYIASKFFTISYYCFVFGAFFKLLYSSVKYFFNKEAYLFNENKQTVSVANMNYNSYLMSQIFGNPFWGPISFTNYLKIHKWQKEIIEPYFKIKFHPKTSKKISDNLSSLYIDSPENIKVLAIIQEKKYKFSFPKQEFNNFAKNHPIDIRMYFIVAYNIVLVYSPFLGKILFKIIGELKLSIWLGGDYAFNSVMAKFLILKYFSRMRLKDKIFCLEQAICYSDQKVINYILRQRFDLNGTCSSAWTALQCAIAEKQYKIAKKLLELGATPNTSNIKEIAPIHFAAKYNELKSVKLLIKYGANIDSQTIYGDTPLMFAISNQNMQMINFLIDKGTNVLLKDSYGNTAEDYARKERLGELALRLKKISEGQNS